VRFVRPLLVLVVCAVAGLASGRAIVAARTAEPPPLASATTNGLVTLEGVGAANPLLLDLGPCRPSMACNYLAAKASLGQADLRGIVVPDTDVEDTRRHLAALREYGLRHLPDATAAADGAALIVAEAGRATPDRPLLVLSTWPATSVTDAHRIDPGVADRVVVVLTGRQDIPEDVSRRFRAVVADPPGPLPPLDGARGRVEREMPLGVLRDVLLASPAVAHGDVVGDAAFALYLYRPYTWRAVEPRDGGLALTAFDVPEAGNEWFSTMTDPALHGDRGPPPPPAPPPASEPEPSAAELFRVSIDFAPANAPLADGYERDAGEAYDDRGGGLEYGWDEGIEDDLRVRGVTGDVRYDTLAHFSKDGDRTWEIAVPDGTYDVRLALGDPSHTDQLNTLDVEGTVVGDAEQDNFDTAVVAVEVTDGRLTIRPGPGAHNAKICFVKVRSVG
jgi:hypothetical protein